MSDFTHEDLYQMIRSHWRHEIAPEARWTRTMSTAQTTTGGRNREQQKNCHCYSCKEVGHPKKDSPKKKNKPSVSGRKGESGKRCTPHGSSTHSDDECKVQLAKKQDGASANTIVPTTSYDTPGAAKTTCGRIGYTTEQVACGADSSEDTSNGAW